MTMIPKACPHCGSDELNVPVKAWAIYKDGKYHILDMWDGEVDDSDADVAHCPKCGAEISLDSFDPAAAAPDEECEEELDGSMRRGMRGFTGGAP